jgi:hypothetical protein
MNRLPDDFWDFVPLIGVSVVLIAASIWMFTR